MFIPGGTISMIEFIRQIFSFIVTAIQDVISIIRMIPTYFVTFYGWLDTINLIGNGFITSILVIVISIVIVIKIKRLVF